MTRARQTEGGVFGPAIIMVVVSILLFWLPFLGPVIAGFVGGRQAGSVGRAIVAALLPSLFFAVMLTCIFTIFGLPFMGFIAGIGFTGFAVLNSGALLLGAIIGGAF